jgi:hypothetical protein
MNILLSSVFGPFGIDDQYGIKENVMELFHSQVTRQQGLFSLRCHHHSFGLYFIAENIDAPVTVLDFPSEKRFVREIKKGYDYVGISFIVPNFSRAKRMAQLVRQYAPDSKIILGGHGTRIEGVEELIHHDFICKGEGVKWFRRLPESLRILSVELQGPGVRSNHPGLLFSLAGLPCHTAAGLWGRSP